MAYPMVQWPTFAEFRNRLERDFGCRYVEGGEVVVNGVPVGWLERDADGSTRRYAVTYSADCRLAPSVVRSICVQLQVDPEAFGLTIETESQDV